MGKRNRFPRWGWLSFLPLAAAGLVLLLSRKHRPAVSLHSTPDFDRMAPVDHIQLDMDEPTPPTASETQPPAPPAAEAETSTPDDLTVLEGIGPKIAAVLNAAGISTYRQLATADEDRLREILLAARLRLADPATWPEQAGLAADADWEAFHVLTAQLKGGRRPRSPQPGE